MGWRRCCPQSALRFDVPPEQILARGRLRPRILARSPTCYRAVREPGLPPAEFARRFSMTRAGISDAVGRGERVASESGLQLDEDKLLGFLTSSPYVLCI